MVSVIECSFTYSIVCSILCPCTIPMLDAPPITEDVSRVVGSVDILFTSKRGYVFGQFVFFVCQQDHLQSRYIK